MLLHTIVLLFCTLNALNALNVTTETPLEDDEIAKIIGGSDAKVKEFPFMALIKINGSFACGGTLIKKGL